MFTNESQLNVVLAAFYISVNPIHLFQAWTILLDVMVLCPYAYLILQTFLRDYHGTLRVFLLASRMRQKLGSVFLY